MKARPIHYREGLKYQLASDYTCNTGVIPPYYVAADYVSLDRHGNLWVRKGYAWDGPSGPTFDTRSVMRASLVHDAFFQLLRLGLLPESARPAIDAEYRRIAIEDGTSWVRAALHHYVLRHFAATPGAPKRVRTAP